MFFAIKKYVIYYGECLIPIDQNYGVILFVDDENPDCFGIMFVGARDWCFGYSEDLEAVCK